MKKSTLLLLLLFCSVFVFGQETKDFPIFKNTKNWKKEIIKFPIDWAPDLKVTGFEELLFSPKWADSKSDQFWSLVIAWKIHTESLLTLKEVEDNLKSYFDGLMKPNHWSKDFPSPKIKFIKNKNSLTNFTGEMTFFDGFHSGKVITVYIKGEQLFCIKQQKEITIFRLSPKNIEHKVWKNLNTIKLQTNICN